LAKFPVWEVLYQFRRARGLLCSRACDSLSGNILHAPSWPAEFLKLATLVCFMYSADETGANSSDDLPAVPQRKLFSISPRQRT
jgi:hypothetical protein